MKKFKFSLDKVLELKMQLLDREKNLLASLRQGLAYTESEIERCELEFQELNQKVQRGAQTGIKALELRALQYQIDHSRYEMEQLKKAKRGWEEKIEIQLKVVLQIQQEVSGMDKLKEYQLEEYNRTEAKAQEAVISEFVSGKVFYQKKEA